MQRGDDRGAEVMIEVLKLVYACSCFCLCDTVESLNREIRNLTERVLSEDAAARMKSMKELRSLLEIKREPVDRRIKSLTKRILSENADARAKSLKELRSLLEYERNESVNHKIETLTERISSEDVRARVESLKKVRSLLKSQRWRFQGFYVGLGVSRKYTKDNVYCPISESNPAPVVVAPIVLGGGGRGGGAPIVVPPPPLAIVPTNPVIVANMAATAGAADGGVLAGNVATRVADADLLAAAIGAVSAVPGATAAADAAVVGMNVTVDFLRVASYRAAYAVEAGATPTDATIVAVATTVRDAGVAGVATTADQITKAIAAAAIAADDVDRVGYPPGRAADAAVNVVDR
ncbi:MAG: hypothetical protein LBC04_03865 [Holosporaceae bacterium]|nr:hypothetical protein [Holosporaceae bacterium]